MARAKLVEAKDAMMKLKERWTWQGQNAAEEGNSPALNFWVDRLQHANALIMAVDTLITDIDYLPDPPPSLSV